MRPSSNLYLEDFAPGQRYETAEHLVVAADTIRFAREFDPQPLHVDPEAGARSVFGGLIAPGPYTLCISLRLFFDLNLWETAMIASPGMRDVKWLLPVRPGDRLRAVAEVTEILAFQVEAGPRRRPHAARNPQPQRQSRLLRRLSAPNPGARRLAPAVRLLCLSRASAPDQSILQSLAFGSP